MLKMKSKFLLRAVLLVGSTLLTLSCSGASSNTSSDSMNLAGNWTVTAISGQGQGTVSGTTNVTQSGQGLGTNGVTTLTTVIGSINVTQSGANLTGTITDSIHDKIYNFTGTLSGGNITITGGSVPCNAGYLTGTRSTSITGTVTSTNMQGNYTITSASACYNSGDAGTWTATKQ